MGTRNLKSEFSCDQNDTHETRLVGTAKPLFGGSNPPVASISTQTEEAPEKSGAFSRLTATLTATCSDLGSVNDYLVVTEQDRMQVVFIQLLSL